MTPRPTADQPDDDRSVLERLQKLLLTVDDINAFLTELARLATTVVPGRDPEPSGPSGSEPASVEPAGPVSCGITVRYDGHLVTVGSSDVRAEALDETQYRSGGGPCLQSLRTGEVVDSPDAGQEQRWPDYIPAAMEAGMRCSLSLPLTGDSATFGAMNLYGFDRPHLFGDAEQRRLGLFAAQAAGTLQLATRRVKDTTLLTQMEQALRSRTTIDQALGILMAQQRCTIDEAFALLRREAQNSRRRLRDIAADLIIRTTGQQPDPGRPFEQS
jgi:GAF domain-containing protein